MKNRYFFGVLFVGVSFLSCKKNYLCECKRKDVTPISTSVNSNTQTMQAISKKRAQKTCNSGDSDTTGKLSYSYCKVL